MMAPYYKYMVSGKIAAVMKEDLAGSIISIVECVWKDPSDKSWREGRRYSLIKKPITIHGKMITSKKITEEEAALIML